MVETGMCDISIPKNDDGAVDITFSKKFAYTPTVLFSIVNSTSQPGTWGYNTIAITKLTTTGFGARVHSFDTIARELRINWIAIL
jgi:hypothetical protein